MNHKQWKIGRGGLGVLFLPILVLACGALVGGCESESVAPHDELPQLTEREATQQAALVAVGISKVGPELLNFNGLKAFEKELGVYTRTFPEGGDITGSIILEYFDGGPSGLHSLWEDADYGLFYTPEGERVTIEVEIPDVGTSVFALDFDLHGDIDQEADTATVSGSGNLTTGDYNPSFTITNVVLTELSSYPEGGTFEFVAGTITVMVEYDGDVTASVWINGVITYVIDLDTGIVTLIGG